MGTKILLALIVMAGVASAQPAPPKITIGIYAPSVEFGTAQARLTYVQGLAKAIEQSTSIKTDAYAYASMSALKKANVDYAIVDGPCFATNLGWKLLANATIDGGTSRTYALWSSAGNTMQSLRGKKLAYVQTGCNDDGFIFNAMLETEVDPTFFSGRPPENDLTAAVAAVQSYKTAQGVFAPASAVKSLTKVFDTGSVPNPAFVEVNAKMPNNISAAVGAAVSGYGGSGAISGWTKPNRDPYQSLASRFTPNRKGGVFASPDAVRLNPNDVLAAVPSLNEPFFVAVRHHFVRGPARMGGE
ncbi:MAG TPA: hypothetical protein VFV99_07650 [Kofleriaceae bacterium]|nr:hypothetical protein [Kofleriaceae bacterium]